jgi:recombination protein RecT
MENEEQKKHLVLIRKTVDQNRERFESVRSGMNFEKESVFAIQQLQKNEYLQKCIIEAPETLAASIINVATTGLTLNPALGYAYLVPRKNKSKNRVECILDVSYRGLIHLLTLSGGVGSVSANIRYKGDQFDIDLGTSPKITHKPMFATKEFVGVYAVAVLPNNTVQFDYMTKEEIDNIKLRSEMGKDDKGAWKSDYGEMAKKTVIKRLSKYLPKNDTMLRAMEAIQLDNDNNGIDFEEENKRMANIRATDKVKGALEQTLKLSTGALSDVPAEELKLLNTIQEQFLLCNNKEEVEDYWVGVPDESKALPRVVELYNKYKEKYA